MMPLFACFLPAFYRAIPIKKDHLMGVSPLSMRLMATHSPVMGKVSLVGAGPYDPDLLTIKGLKALQSADVVIYDRLVNPEILMLANPSALMLYVGKQSGVASVPQSDINQLLIDHASQGHHVVRLKGGDPFIFGRGGEEALALVAANVPYELIPGITAAIGCSASAMIPLTHRKLARSVTFVTGHTLDDSDFSAWSALIASGQTLVFYMGLETASAIQLRLQQTGLSDATPFAIVSHGCSPKQRVSCGTLSQLSAMAKCLEGESPSLIMVGEVVLLRETLNQTLTSMDIGSKVPSGC